MVLPSKGSSSPQPKSSPKPAPSPKDSSLFRGRTHIGRQEVRTWLKRDDVSRTSGGMARDKRVELERKLFSKGQYANKKEAEKAFKTLKDYSEKSKREFGVKSDAERKKVLNVVKQILGK